MPLRLFLPKSNLMWPFSDRLFGWCKDKKETENLRFTRRRIEESWYPWLILPSPQSSVVNPPMPVAVRSNAWVCGLSCLLGLRGSNPLAEWMDGCLECCVLSRSLCNGLITRPEASYRVWCVCDREAWTLRRPCPARGCRAIKKKLMLLATFCVWLHILFLDGTYFVGLKWFVI